MPTAVDWQSPVSPITNGTSSLYARQVIVIFPQPWLLSHHPCLTAAQTFMPKTPARPCRSRPITIQHVQYSLKITHILRDYKRKCKLTLAEKFEKCFSSTITRRPQTTTRVPYTPSQIQTYTMWSTLTMTVKLSHRQNLRNIPNQCPPRQTRIS